MYVKHTLFVCFFVFSVKWRQYSRVVRGRVHYDATQIVHPQHRNFAANSHVPCASFARPRIIRRRIARMSLNVPNFTFPLRAQYSTLWLYLDDWNEKNQVTWGEREKWMDLSNSSVQTWRHMRLADLSIRFIPFKTMNREPIMPKYGGSSAVNRHAQNE